MRHTVEGADAQDGDQDQQVPQESGRDQPHQLRHHRRREDREGRLSTRQGGAAWGQLDDPAGAWAVALGFGSQAKGATPVETTERLAASMTRGIPAPRRGRTRPWRSAWTGRARASEGGPVCPGRAEGGSSSSYHGPSLCRSPPLAPLLGALVDLFSSGGKKKKEWDPSGVQLRRARRSFPRLLAVPGAAGCRRAGNPRARGVRAHGGLGEWTPPRAGGPWSRAAPGVRGGGWSGEPADWSRAFRPSRESPRPRRAERTVTRESAEKVHSRLGIPRPPPSRIPGTSLGHSLTSGNVGTGPLRDREILVSSIPILGELGDSGVGYVKREAPQTGSILPAAPRPGEASGCLEKFPLWLCAERRRLLGSLAAALRGRVRHLLAIANPSHHVPTRIPTPPSLCGSS